MLLRKAKRRSNLLLSCRFSVKLEKAAGSLAAFSVPGTSSGLAFVVTPLAGRS
jgi:hypothetical protein